MKDARLSKQATLQIVADHAGVSKATASMILSGRSKYVDLFTPDTIRKVQRSAAALGYRTNIFASNLEPSRTPFFALIIAGSQPDEWAYDAFESLFVAGVLAVSADAGAHPIVLTVSKEAPHAHVKSAEDIVFGGVFGTIARTPPASIEARLQEQLQREQPVVAVFPENASRWSSNMIEADNAAMGAVAGDLFACDGRKKWALICFKATAASQEVRRESLAEAARRHGAKLEVVRLDANPLFAREFPASLVPRLLRIRPDAIFGVNTAASGGAVMAVTTMGLQPGRDVAIIGVDYPHWAEEMMGKGSVTSLSVSWKGAGKTAMEKLLEMRTSGEHRFPNLLLKPTLRIGQSCPVPAEVANSNSVFLITT